MDTQLVDWIKPWVKLLQRNVRVEIYKKKCLITANP